MEPGESIKLIERVKGSGSITRVRMRFYPGQERDLRIIPYVNHLGNKQESLVTFSEFGGISSDPYIAGDDDREDFDCHVEVRNDDEIVIEAKNVNAAYAYDVVVYVTVNYDGEDA